MSQTEFEQFIADLPNVQRVENSGYTFFFVGDDHRLPFVSVSDSDNDYDDVSNLNREGVFRVNIKEAHSIAEARFQRIAARRERTQAK